MSIERFISRPVGQVEDDIRKDVIEIRRYLPRCGYREVAVFKEGRNGLIYCALWELVELPPDPVLAIAYGRVSTDLQSDNHSLATQVRQQLELAAERGHTIRYIYVDAGYTGRDDRRPAFSRMMRRSVQGDIAADYTYDLYRFYRNLHGLSGHYIRLRDNGVELVSVAEKHVDFSSREGKLLLYLKGIVGEVYLDDLSRTTRDNKYSRALKGYSNASQPPFGYCRGDCKDCKDPNGADYCPRFGGHDLWRELGDDPKVFVPHPIESVAFQLAAEWYVTGRYSDTDIARMLNDYQYRPDNSDTVVRFRPKGRPGRIDENRRFRKDSIRDLLQNPYHAGFVVYREMKKRGGERFQTGRRVNPFGQTHDPNTASAIWFPGLHVPLISQELFERCLQVRGAKGHLPRSDVGRDARVYPLSGILRCVRDGGTFRGTAARGDIRYYEDVNRAQGVSDCPVRAIRAETLEEQVFAYVQQVHIPEEWYPDILGYLRDDDRWNEHRRQRRSLESRLRTLKTEFEMGEVSRSEYVQAKRNLDRQLQRLARRDEEAEEDLTPFLSDFPCLWAAATPLEKKVLLRCIFLDIHVRDGGITGYDPRDPFRPLFPAA